MPRIDDYISLDDYFEAKWEEENQRVNFYGIVGLVVMFALAIYFSL